MESMRQGRNEVVTDSAALSPLTVPGTRTGQPW